LTRASAEALEYGIVGTTRASSRAALTAANIPLDLTIASDLVYPGGTPVVPSLTTPEGEAATADWYLYADLL
jgi:hypothetical protein